MTERKPVSKRLRYEILRRDNHTCRYCGATAPDTTITVDHVVPVALGGSNEPANLVAACVDCNAGKTSTSPDDPLVEEASDDATRWAQAMRDAAQEMQERNANRDDTYERIDQAWTRGSRPVDWTDSIDQFINAGLTADLILDLVNVAQRKRGAVDYRWAYFCGCCWRRIRDLQDRAAEIANMDVPAAATPAGDAWMDDFEQYLQSDWTYHLGRLLPVNEAEAEKVIRERFHECPVHRSFDCTDTRCFIARMISGAAWATTESLNELNAIITAKVAASKRRTAMKAAYRLGYDDAVAGRAEREDW